MEPTLIDRAETIRRRLLVQINTQSVERGDLEKLHGQVWTTKELTGDFAVLGFRAPLVVVRRKHDNRLGSLFFQHHPRYYFAFQEDK